MDHVPTTTVPYDAVQTGLDRGVRAIKDGLYDPANPCVELFDWTERRSGVQRVKLFAGLVLIAAMYLASSGAGTALLANVIGFAYPVCIMCMTMGRLQLADRHQQHQQHQHQHQQHYHDLSVQWFVYWMVFATVLVARQLFGRLVGLVPCHSLVQVAFLVWCITPVDINGAAIINSMVVDQYFTGHFTGR